MKCLKFSLLLLLVSLTMVSCLDSESNFTPTISLYRPVCVHPGDTVAKAVAIRQNAETGYYHIDTLMVGDTLRYLLRLDSYTNALTRFTLTHNVAMQDVQMQIDSIHQAFDLGACTPSVLVPREGYNMIMFPVECVALQPGRDTIRMHLESNSRFSPADITLIQHIR